MQVRILPAYSLADAPRRAESPAVASRGAGLPDTTHQLTSAMAVGDEQAVDRFYRRFFDRLYTQARRATGRDEAFCLDVVQDAVVRIIRTVRPVASEAQLLGWMRLVVQTTALDHLRRERRRATRESVMIMASSSDTTKTDPFDEARHAWLSGQIARFDPQLIRMIEMRYTRQWTLTRIVGALGLSVGTIDGRLRRAIGDLRLRAAEVFDD